LIKFKWIKLDEKGRLLMFATSVYQNLDTKVSVKVFLKYR